MNGCGNTGTEARYKGEAIEPPENLQ